MQTPTSELPADRAGLLDLGVVLGQAQAFNLVAGRCSAAQAAGLQRLRKERLYKICTPHWEEFCSRYLRISRAEADKIIRLQEEFGARYFEVAQLTRISPQTYRAIQPSVKDGALHVNGESIELSAENATRVAAAVSELRRTLQAPLKKAPRQLEMHERIADLDVRCRQIVAEFEEISEKESCGENWLLFVATLTRTCSALRRIEMQNDAA